MDQFQQMRSQDGLPPLQWSQQIGKDAQKFAINGDDGYGNGNYAPNFTRYGQRYWDYFWFAFPQTTTMTTSFTDSALLFGLPMLTEGTDYANGQNYFRNYTADEWARTERMGIGCATHVYRQPVGNAPVPGSLFKLIVFFERPQSPEPQSPEPQPTSTQPSEPQPPEPQPDQTGPR